MGDDPEKEILQLAREIGYGVWRNRAVAWRKRERIKIDERWLESVRRGFEWGDYDDEDTVQGALMGIKAGMKL